MKKNCLIQLRIETSLLEKLRKQAEESGITISDLCRQKMQAPSLLAEIDEKLEYIKKQLSN
jgi:hypothetical protein